MEYKTPFLGQIRSGINNTYPKQANKRSAFLLPHFVRMKDFIAPGDKSGHLVRLATVMGFIGMLRPHTFAQLQPSSFYFVCNNEKLLQPSNAMRSFPTFLKKLPRRQELLGFYIVFKSKTMPVARAYFPNLSDSCSALRMICPLSMLLSAANKKWVTAGFLKRAGRGESLGKYLKLLTSSDESVSPYSLRIGGRTWYISHGMDRQFCDYLGTWKSPEASARYFQASLVTALRKLLKFYKKMKSLKDALGNI